MVGERFIFKNNQITIYPYFTFMPKAGVGLSKKGVSFYCETRIVVVPKTFVTAKIVIVVVTSYIAVVKINP